MKRIVIGIGIIVCLAVITLLAAGCYRTLFAQKVAHTFDVNSPDLATHLLIATQGSAFKDAVVAALVKELEQRPIYIKIIDVSDLSTIVEAEWQAFVIVNTCQSGQLQPDVAAFLMRTAIPANVMLATTSGSGRWQPEGPVTDSISSASRKGHVQFIVTEIVSQVTGILEKSKG